MGCTEEKYICFRNKKRFKNNNNSSKEEEIKNLEHQNTKNENKKEIQNQIKEDREDLNKNELNEQFNKENQYKNNHDFEEDKKEENEYEEEEDDDEVDEIDYNNIPYGNLQMLRELEPYLQTKNNPNFNFPEVKENIYVGKGLRRMKGYISIVPKEELEKMRIAFWGTRVEGDSQVWTFLKELCELPKSEEKNIKAMLEVNEITPLLKCINVTYDKSGEVYEIPNYCINDPVSYDLPEMHVKKPKKKLICFHARKGTKQIKIKSSNYTLIEKIKDNIAKKILKKPEEIRMFFGGKELKNGNELWKYNINDDCVVVIL